MKTPLKILLIALGIITGLTVILASVYLVYFASMMKEMKITESGEIVSGIYAVKDSYVNMYLVRTESGYIAVDAAIDKARVKTELDKLQIDPAQVLAIFLTHTDADHVGSIELFKNARVYISKDEEQFVNGKTSRFLVFGNKLPCKYELLDDNAEIYFDSLHVRAITTPGHTTGSMSYLVNGKYLFTGDCLSLKSGKADIFSTFINMDNIADKASIKKLKTIIGAGYIFTAHHGYSNNIKEVFSSW